MLLRLIGTAVVLGWTGCGGGDLAPDEPIVFDASAFITDAGSTDAGLGGGRSDAGPADAGVDGGGPPVDAGSACDCPEPPPCQVSTCVEGACVSEPGPDRTACGELADQLCVLGVCMPPGCGNGLVEPGEECDDGNTLAGDACVGCESQPAALVVAEAGLLGAPVLGSPSLAPWGSSLAMRGSGLTIPVPVHLVVWSEVDELGGTRLLGRAHGLGLEPLGPAVVLAPQTRGPRHASVAATFHGWVVAWATPGRPGRVQHRRIRVLASGDLQPGAIRTTGPEPEAATSVNYPVVTTVGSEALVVWLETGNPRGVAPCTIRGRFLDRFGAPRASIEVHDGLRQCFGRPAVSVRGDVWLVSWLEAGSGIYPELRARRFHRTEELDPAAFLVASDGGQPAVAADASGSFTVVWDFLGDLFARTVADHSITDDSGAHFLGPVTPITMTLEPEVEPSVQALGLGAFFIAYSPSPSEALEGAGFTLSPAGSIPARLAGALAPRLNRSDGFATVTQGRDGLWVSWLEGLPRASPGPPGPPTLHTMFVPREMP